MPHNDGLSRPGAFQHYFDHHPDGMLTVDLYGGIQRVNASALFLLGYAREELLEIPFERLFGPSDMTGDSFEGTVAGKFVRDVPHRQGFPVHLKITCVPLESDGREVGSLITLEEMPRQNKRNKEISDVQEMLGFITEKSQNIISTFSPDGVFTYISPTVTALLGYMPDEVIGKHAAAFNHPEDNMKLLKFRSLSSIDRDTVRFTGRVRHKNGEYRWYETNTEYIRNEAGEVIQTVCVGSDITDRKQAEETITWQAYHDSLTELPNRRSFKQRAERLLAEAAHALHGLLLLDLDGFKFVNDKYGHDAGDRLLIEVAQRLTRAVGDQGTVARWGGDEFTVLLANLASRDDLSTLTSRIQAAISEPLAIAEHVFDVGASIGCSLSPDDGATLEALLRNADASMYRAKNQTKIKP